MGHLKIGNDGLLIVLISDDCVGLPDDLPSLLDIGVGLRNISILIPSNNQQVNVGRNFRENFRKILGGRV